MIQNSEFSRAIHICQKSNWAGTIFTFSLQFFVSNAARKYVRIFSLVLWVVHLKGSRGICGSRSTGKGSSVDKLLKSVLIQPDA